MKKYIISVVVVVAFGIYVLLTYQSSTSVPTPVAATSNNEAAAATTTSSATASTSSAGAAGSPNPPISVATGAYKDGTYTGSTANAYFGNIQVVAVVSGGKISDIQVPVYPSDNGHSQQVSDSALPVLKQEAIQIQSANVNIVSGATQTSEAFQQSLQAALALAKN